MNGSYTDTGLRQARVIRSTTQYHAVCFWPDATIRRAPDGGNFNRQEPFFLATSSTSNLSVVLAMDDAVKGSTGVEASCNPSCLKWQTYLKLLKIPFVSVASSNHASPSGSLPFLLPAPSKGPASQPPSPVTANKLLRWSKGEAKITDEVSDVRLEAYEALLDGPIRKAWLFHLYLCHPNFSSVAAPCYIQPSSSNPLVGAALSYELRSAATAEILKSSSLTAAGPFKVLDAESLYVQAEDALSALSTLLGTHEWFFDAKQPGLMDASVFSYTHLLLDDALEWSDKRLNDDLRNRVCEESAPISDLRMP
ncbi:hypothetical protein EV356DRAFT_563233 [Viridothelium virens]|uniref:Mitochondrial outer membrane transport complex Sam37/metaxin N-terminal domain-containing protein n=1 Tax=Viridothelium virens TaxID=1048519 RepID=A0A6A6HMJ5_VIRVR|nr:hypothetical protein EV356DRAFT_563233 [Viridothelium virens]